LELLPQKNEVKNAHQMQSCWIVALLLCNNQFFLATACKRAFFYIALQ
jgi:hypothetical protein